MISDKKKTQLGKTFFDLCKKMTKEVLIFRASVFFALRCLRTQLEGGIETPPPPPCTVHPAPSTGLTKR